VEKFVGGARSYGARLPAAVWDRRNGATAQDLVVATREVGSRGVCPWGYLWLECAGPPWRVVAAWWRAALR
jgi:hypothetical protein